MTIMKNNKCSVVYNCDTGVIHAKHSLFHEELTACGHVWMSFPAVTTGKEPLENITCKNCLRSLEAYTSHGKHIDRAMKTYEFGEHDSMAEPTWIKTNRNIRLTSAAKRTGKYLKKISFNFKSAAGIDLVIT